MSPAFPVWITSMQTTAPKTPKRRYPDAVWQEVEKRACAGIPLQTLSDAYGIGMATINDRSKRYAWPTPARLARRRGAGGCPGKAAIVAVGLRGQMLPGERENQAAVPECVAALAALASDPPAAFQAALVPVMQNLLARGLQNIAPPRTVADVKTLTEIHRRASGLDARDVGRGLVLINPMRPVRGCRTVDAVAIDAIAYEV
jgi:hypothetical protein